MSVEYWMEFPSMTMASRYPSAVDAIKEELKRIDGIPVKRTMQQINLWVFCGIADKFTLQRLLSDMVVGGAIDFSGDLYSLKSK